MPIVTSLRRLREPKSELDPDTGVWSTPPKPPESALISEMLLRELVRVPGPMVTELYDAKGESIFWDDTAEPWTVCRVNVDDRNEQVRVVWLLPFGAPAGRLVPVFTEAMLDASSRNPQATRYVVEAFFPSRRQCDAWKLYFTGATVEPHNAQWRIALPSFGDAIRVIETWR